MYILTDINECNGTDNGGCVQQCNNTDGSYFCSCNSAYTLAADSRGCDGMCELYYCLGILYIIIIIIAFKGASRDFFGQSPHSAANCLQHVRSSGPGVIVCKSRATQRALITCKCHVTSHLVQRDSSAIQFDRVEIAFI